MKTVVTHIGPDLDAITSVWLVKTFFPGWEEAHMAFVPAGTTLRGEPPDGDPEIIHVDTGFGTFDHHQTDEDTCAAKLVYAKMRETRKADPALERLLEMVKDTDHFREVFYPEPTSDIWNMSIVSAIDGWRLIHADNPMKIVSLGMDAMDGIYKNFQNKVWAENEIREKGVIFESEWGKAIAIETVNDEVVHLGQKMGYMMVIRKDPAKGYLRIKALPKPEIDLTRYFEVMKSGEPEATWFLHASKHMILNGSSKNPDIRPSKKSLDDVIAIFKKT